MNVVMRSGVAIVMDTVGEFYNSRCFSLPNQETLVFSRGFSSDQEILLPILDKLYFAVYFLLSVCSKF